MLLIDDRATLGGAIRRIWSVGLRVVFLRYSILLPEGAAARRLAALAGRPLALATLAAQRRSD